MSVCLYSTGVYLLGKAVACFRCVGDHLEWERHYMVFLDVGFLGS